MHTAASLRKSWNSGETSPAASAISSRVLVGERLEHVDDAGSLGVVEGQPRGFLEPIDQIAGVIAAATATPYNASEHQHEGRRAYRHLAHVSPLRSKVPRAEYRAA